MFGSKLKLCWSLWEFVVGDSVIGFGEVEEDGDSRLFLVFASEDVVYDGGESGGGVGVGTEGVLGGGDEVVGSEVMHELRVGDGVENFADDGEKGDWAEIFWDVEGRFLGEWAYFRNLGGVGVGVLINGIVVGVGDVRGDEGG